MFSLSSPFLLLHWYQWTEHFLVYSKRYYSVWKNGMEDTARREMVVHVEVWDEQEEKDDNKGGVGGEGRRWWGKKAIREFSGGEEFQMWEERKRDKVIKLSFCSPLHFSTVSSLDDDPTWLPELLLNSSELLEGSSKKRIPMILMMMFLIFYLFFSPLKLKEDAPRCNPFDYRQRDVRNMMMRERDDDDDDHAVNPLEAPAVRFGLFSLSPPPFPHPH